MNNRHRIKCAIVGLGRIGSTLEFDSKREKPASHAGAIREHKNTILSAGCDIDIEKCRKFEKDWNCQSTFLSMNEMLESVAIDILHIATPPETHKPLLKAALMYKIPVIILEKPVSDCIRDAKIMERLALGTGSKIVINHERRYSLQYQRVKKVISERIFGNLLSVNTKMYMGRNRALQGMIYDDGTHMIDLVNYLCGTSAVIKSVLGSEKKGYAILNCLFGDVPVEMEFARKRDYLLFELDFSFERGRIVVGNGCYDEYESHESPYYENFRSLIRTEKVFQKTEYFKQMFADAVRCFREEDYFPVSGITDGVEAVRIIDSIIRKI